MEEYAAVESEVPPAWLIDNLATTTSEMFVLCLEARRSTNNWDCLAQITAPVLLVSGTEESSISDLDAAIERIARCQGMRLDGYGHLQTFWHAEVTAPLIVDFLRSQVPNFSG
jgi:pimeloyl-ACP methyl ester carboxylesterase